MKNKRVIALSVTGIAIGAIGVSAAIFTSTNSSDSNSSAPTTNSIAASTSPSEIPLDTPQEVSSASTTEELLVYLIEEEKLAHDVYTVLGDAWGGYTFTNILSSETTHQDQVLSLLSSYGIADPRSSAVGVFVNPELQALYDQLIAQGMQSQTEAYKVGVLIEETDIADLTVAINSSSDQAIVNTLNKLLSASQRHLSTFSKKL
jgi:hypothetical protein